LNWLSSRKAYLESTLSSNKELVSDPPGEENQSQSQTLLESGQVRGMDTISHLRLLIVQGYITYTENREY